MRLPASRFRVAPRPAEDVGKPPADVSLILGAYLGTGCLLWPVISFVLYAALGKDEVGLGFGRALPWALGVTLVIVVVGHAVTNRSWRKQAQKAEQLRRVQEASTLERELLTSLEAALERWVGLTPLLATARAHIATARDEFSERAFAPFWEEVEKAAGVLGQYSGELTTLSRFAAEYDRSLTGEQHTFPAVPFFLGRAPDPLPVASELQEVVRMAQKDFEFANIWEHRRTREVLIAGFRNLEAAIYGLEGSLVNALEGLSLAMASEVGLSRSSRGEEARELREEVQQVRRSLD